MPEEKIFGTSDAAAHFRTDVSGWVSRNGFFYGKDEASARRDGATHVLCRECEQACAKGRTLCDSCSSDKRAQRHAAMKQVAWNEKGALYSLLDEKFFFSWEEVNDYIDQQDAGDSREIADYDKHYAVLLLVVCEPVYLRPIEYDAWADALPEDTDLSDTVCAAIDEFNAVLRAEGPVSWTPGNTRPEIRLTTKMCGETHYAYRI